MAELKITLCDIDNCAEPSIAEYNGIQFCSHDHWIVHWSRQWPTLVNEINSLEQLKQLRIQQKAAYGKIGKLYKTRE